MMVPLLMIQSASIFLAATKTSNCKIFVKQQPCINVFSLAFISKMSFLFDEKSNMVSVSETLRNPTNDFKMFFGRVKLWKSFVVLDVRGCVMCLGVFVFWESVGISTVTWGCECVFVCCYILQLPSLTMVTTDAFFLATRIPLLSANQDGEAPPSRPMVRLPCLHAPRRQGPWLSIQGSGARETRGERASERGGLERGWRWERGWRRPLWVERVYGCSQALSISGSGEQRRSGHGSS